MSAAIGQQVALTRTNKTNPSHVPKSVRPVVPAFLQKLYEMVNDPKNSELIRWSEAGDSFYVLDHERFAREVLGRWFKHQNFNSFVRQLNMYGFHKIPHLQQGVLKSDSETEFWNFAHANFHLGQPDLLCLIQRKKQGPAQGEAGMDVRESPNNNQSTMATFTSGQVVDIQSILNGITVLKRHQTTLSSELNGLKQSNQALWQEALAARERHQRQQDTINRIVKFLAGIFGQHPQHHKDDRVDSQPSRAVVPRRPTRMIEDRPRHNNSKVEITEVLDEDGMETVDANRKTSPAPMRELMALTPITPAYPTLDFTVETPASAPSPTPSNGSEALSINEMPGPTTFTSTTPHSSAPTVTSASQTPATQESYLTPQNQPTTISPQSTQKGAGSTLEDQSVAPTRSSSSPFDFDPRTVFSGLTPVQIQHFLAALSMQPPTEHLPIPNPPQSSQITPYYDYTHFSNPPVAFPLIGASQDQQLPSEESVIPFDGGMESQLKEQWKDTADIDKDVNALNTSINSLIQTFGLDPNLLDGSHQGNELDASSLDSNHPGPSQIPNTNPQATEAAVREFNFDSFFDTMTAPSMDTVPSAPNMGGYGDMNTSSGFLHEIPNAVATGIRGNMGSAGATSGSTALTPGKKRKSDVAELSTAIPDGNTINPAASLLNPDTADVGVSSPIKPKRRRGQ